MSTGHQQVLAHMAPRGYGELRRWTRSWMAEHPVAGVEPDDVALVMTELVSNSIKYGSGPVLVDLTTEDHLLWLDVGDCSEDMPRQPPPGSAPSGGRGLLILSGLASNWGVRLRPQGGKTVWCVFHGASSANPDTLVLSDAVGV
jgi:anti-sigma regulatory factor (Ser/Thr protein kinase)